MGSCQSKSAAAPSAARTNAVAPSSTSSDAAAAAAALTNRSQHSQASQSTNAKAPNARAPTRILNSPNTSIGLIKSNSGRSMLRKREVAEEDLNQSRRNRRSSHNGTPDPVPELLHLNLNTNHLQTNGSHHGHAPADPSWKQLWHAYPPIDPADVHSVIKELMSKHTNLLSPSEITFLQRRVRYITRRLPRNSHATSTTVKMMGRLRSSNKDTTLESRTLVEKQHLLDEAVVRRLWTGEALSVPHPEWDARYNLTATTSSSTTPDVDPIGSAHVLLLHLSSELLWDRVKAIAQDSCQRAGLTMDVNKKVTLQENGVEVVPAPPALSLYVNEPVDLPGVSFNSVCYLVALALRGSRAQRLQLLFYLMLPPTLLTSFLTWHPAGGIPTWLLEVDNGGVVISLASLTHYYYFGRAFLPSTAIPSSVDMEGTKKAKALVVSSQAVMETMASLLHIPPPPTIVATSMSIGSSPSSPEKASPPPSRSNSRHRRASRSDSNGQTLAMESSHVPPSPVMESLNQIREGQRMPHTTQPKDEMDRFWAACDAHWNGPELHGWTLEAFAKWSNDALDETMLDTIMHRLFATGILLNAESEKELVLKRWKEWQENDIRLWTVEEDHYDVLSYVNKSIRNFFHLHNRQDSTKLTSSTRVCGGIGGFDGRGGLGHGIVYCIDKKWWDAWEHYVGWDWEGQFDKSTSRSRQRPGEISTERLLDRTSNSAVEGTLGSYEVMKSHLIKGADYVLIPAGVWDVLYELYGGGPPLPRMVLPPRIEPRERSFSTDSKQMEEGDTVSVDGGIEFLSSARRLLPIPEAFGVATHPWILHCHVCDAQQPYRRGDAGPISIRIMATPDQPLWRLYAEIIFRLPIQNPTKAMTSEGRGQARLWKRMEPAGPKDPSARYGPWSLLCKNRSAILPVINQNIEFEDNYDELKDDWQAFADHTTVEGIGLANGDRIMMEYAVLNKDDEFIWPRELAAKAGRMRRVADEDLSFRRLVKGVGEDDKVLDPPPSLLGITVDAMDLSGRWFQVEIVQVQYVEDEVEEEDPAGDEKVDMRMESVEVVAQAAQAKAKKGKTKQVRVDFTDFGGHAEWIDVDSDRLAKAGRFTLGKPDEGPSYAETNGKTSTDTKAKSTVATKKSSNELNDQNGGKVCTLPGYGACGLANLGNTCYANSAIQCISYMPLLRAYLLSAQYKATGDLNKDNPLGTGGKLLEEFAELLRVMWSGKYGERSPTRFRSQLGKARPQFSGADQQDAQELLNYMLDVLHEDSNKVKKKPYVEPLEDDWVKNNSLSRVGDEAWRRFLRRNRSIMADVAMGQVLNTVTCPVCNFSSRSFDPFNLLSIPFPMVADVVFECTVIRRGTALNCAQTLNRSRKSGSTKGRFDFKKLPPDPQPPSEQLVVEQYAVAMSRLADIGDLKLRLQNICGIPSNRLKLCKLEEIVVFPDADDGSPVKKHMRVTALPDKEGPCVQVAKVPSDEVGAVPAAPTQIVAFESTLQPRPLPPVKSTDGKESIAEDEDGSTADEEDEDDEDPAGGDARAYSQKERREVKEQLVLYGDITECRVYDTDPLPISKAISRSLWPRSEGEFKLGLRVDAIDHRDHWFPGSVVEIIEGVAARQDIVPNNESVTKTKVRIHFDNFSSKWDETYTIDHFAKGQVRPLYSHATPRVKPTEFLVHHRFHDRSRKTNILFGRAFYLQCQNEWSTARAGAHILAQAARFLQKHAEPPLAGHTDNDSQASETKSNRIYDKTHMAISELIDLLVECDRAYVRTALGISDVEDAKDDTYRNPHFDATAMSTALVKKVGVLLNRLPFDVRVCNADSPIGGKNGTTTEEVTFPFSLMRTIGNYMNARHAVVLHWRDPHTDKKGSTRPTNHANVPVLYIAPTLNIHKASTALLDENDSKIRMSKNSPGSGGLHLRVCLTEFCKVQQWALTDGWRCPHCKDFREGKQHMDLWKLPDLLTFHIKRFNCSARWREKITTKVNFPLTGLDVSEWCHEESPALASDSNVYDLIGVLNHYGGMTGGHYVAMCKATACGADGSEEVAYSYPGYGTATVATLDDSDMDDKAGWRLGGRKDKDASTQAKVAAAAAAKQVSESSEPLWLQFDDDLVEPIPPRNVVSEMAYVLFYRRRRLTPSNIAKYSTLD